MQRLIIFLLILGFISPCLCERYVVGAQNTSYNVIDYGAQGDGESDDSKAFMDAWKETCGTQGTPTLIIPQSKVFMVMNMVFQGPCKATKIYIKLRGTIIAPTMDAWEGDHKVALISISNVHGVTIDGTGGLIDGYGSTWWKCKKCDRPKLLGFNACTNINVSNVRITNSPKAHISIVASKDGIFSHINIRAPSDSPNTDGFDITSSRNILIKDSTIASGDDCISIGRDSSYINATRIACGPGHGISIGSLGRGDDPETVEEVYIRNCNFTNTTNGVRIKTFPGGSGYARKITFENITLIKALNPIIIDQYYNPFTKDEKEAVEVSEVTYRRIQGTSAIDKAINLNCFSTGCHKIVLDQINIVSSQPKKPAYAFCKNAYGTATSTHPNVSCLLE